MRTAKIVMMFLALGMFLVGSCSVYSSEPIAGDLNGDGHLTQSDIALLEEMIASGNDDPAGDLNGDGQVDEADLDELEDLVCEANGADMTDDGECCTTTSDGTLCCDVNFDGDFSNCRPPDHECRQDSDCDVLDCPVYCSAAGKCRCQGMCDEDEDCIILNCPAFCNDNGECGCKIPCQDDEDCAFISRCRSSCADEGHCVCDEDCLGQGEEFDGDPEQNRCCPGLEPIVFAEYWQGECGFVNCLCWVCAACGNGACEQGENPCNCPDDCGTPQCHQAGEHFMDFEGTEVCCEGLTRADDCIPDINNGQVSCACPDCPCFVCVLCGDNVCGAGENTCTCPGDCPSPECTPGETIPCHCMNNYASDPPCYECTEDGTWEAILWHEDPCLCMFWTGCADAFVCDGETGVCEIDCRMVNCDPGTNCNICAEGEYCDENTGLCASGCLGEGERFESFDDVEGRCCEGLVAVPDHFPGDDGFCVGPNCPCFVCTRCGTDGECGLDENVCNCPGDCLGATGCDADVCTVVEGEYTVYGTCPNIPITGQMHRITQLHGCGPMDAEMGDEPCFAFWGYKWDGASCVEMSGACPCYNCDSLYWSQEECEDAHAHCADGQESCSLTFPNGLASVLGATGCIDHNMIYTSAGCYGAVHVTGVSRTMYFTCPFIDENGNEGTCSVSLDDLID